jgi:hypothetical protein
MLSMLCGLGAPTGRLSEGCIGEGKSSTGFWPAWARQISFRFVRTDVTNPPSGLFYKKTSFFKKIKFFCPHLLHSLGDLDIFGVTKALLSVFYYSG